MGGWLAGWLVGSLVNLLVRWYLFLGVCARVCCVFV